MLLYKTLLLMLHHDLIIIYINKLQKKNKPINSLDYYIVIVVAVFHSKLYIDLHTTHHIQSS